MKEKRILKPPKRLFHLSEINHDGEWFKPRVPESICLDGLEDDKIKRVCFSSSISGAFFAISPFGDRQKLYVHVPVGIENIAKSGKLCKPTEEQVYDVSTTNEFWIKKKVKLKCIGKISIGFKTNIYCTKINFKWIEKY